MRDPKEHAENRGFIETVLHYIPGFRGYLKKENRRESDRLQRTWLSDRLQKSKRHLDDYTRTLADAGKIDDLPACDRMRAKLDKVIGRFSSAMDGYSGFFDLVQIDEAVLDHVYQFDAKIVSQVDAVADDLEKLKPQGEISISDIFAKLEDLEDAWDQREDILKGLE